MDRRARDLSAITVPDEEMESVRRMQQAGLSLSLWPFVLAISSSASFKGLWMLS
jgi:hypothetical protein